jgi:hypothetical protein
VTYVRIRHRLDVIMLVKFFNGCKYYIYFDVDEKVRKDLDLVSSGKRGRIF